MKKLLLYLFFFHTIVLFGQSTYDIPADIQQWIDGKIKQKENSHAIKTTNSNTLSKAEKSAVMHVPALKSNKYNDEFFNENPAYLIGYIKNYKAASKAFYLRVISSDVISGKINLPLAINMMPDGRFTVKIPNPHPQLSYLWLGDDFGVPFYIKPEQTLGVIIDMESADNKVTFLENSEQVNKKLMIINSNIPKLNPYFVYGAGKKLSPKDFKDEYTLQYKNTQAKINEYLTKNPDACKTIEIVKFDNMIMYSSKMLEYVIQKRGSVQVPASFYSFLNELPLDNPQLLISSQSSSMIMRLNFLLHSKTREKIDCPIVINNLIISAPGDSIQKKYPKLLNILAQKERILKDSFQLKNSLLLDIMKLHSFASDLSSLIPSEKEPYTAAIKEQMKHPFLKRQVEKLSVLDSEMRTNKTFELSNGEVRNFFDELVAQHKGKYVLVDFWGINCGFCLEDLRNTRDIREKYKNSPEIDFVFITSYSNSPSEKIYEKMVSEQGLTHTYRLPTQLFDAICNALMFNGIPHHTLINKSGKIHTADLSTYRIWPESAIEFILKSN